VLSRLNSIFGKIIELSRLNMTPRKLNRDQVIQNAPTKEEKSADLHQLNLIFRGKKIPI